MNTTFRVIKAKARFNHLEKKLIIIEVVENKTAFADLKQGKKREKWKNSIMVGRISILKFCKSKISFRSD